MPANIGPTELIIVLVIVLLIFGPKRLPGLGRSLGSGMREFKESLTGRSRDDDAAEESRELEEGSDGQEGSDRASGREAGAAAAPRSELAEDEPVSERRG